MNPLSMETKLPVAVSVQFEEDCGEFFQRCPSFCSWLQVKLQDRVFKRQLTLCWGASRYAFQQCLRQPEQFQAMIELGEQQRSFTKSEWGARLLRLLSEAVDETTFDCKLRLFRHQAMLRIIWRDLNRLACFKETVKDLSALADACIQQTLAYHHQQLVLRHGEPYGQVADIMQPQQLIVLAMGKLGASELNLSSDIDLIFCYPSSGYTQGTSQPIDNHRFFNRLAKRLIKSLDSYTPQGWVFRVDMRLRPYGDSGPLVQTVAALEQYYQDQGREWERFAMIKARAVTGDRQQVKSLLATLRAFSYRRYIDFSAIEALRVMKRMIEQEAQRRGLQQDLKLGAGGIRDIEFIAQTFQLIRGGRERVLQQRSLLQVLPYLSANAYLPESAVAYLLAAYVFLRNSEHSIQAFEDCQTQTLPNDTYQQQAMAMVMGFDSWEDYLQQLHIHRQHVSEHFAVLIHSPLEPELEALMPWQLLWQGGLSDDESQILLVDSGFEEPKPLLMHLALLRNSAPVMRMQSVGRDRLDRFMPLLLTAVVATSKPAETVLRILPLVEAVLRRTAYLMLLVENGEALKTLVRLCAASQWISQQLARYPVLLDELLDVSRLYQLPNRADLRNELQQQLLRLPLDDLEGHMEGLRYFRLAHTLKVAAGEVAGHLTIMQVSDYLSWLAEVVLEHVLSLAWHGLEQRHGSPQTPEGEPCERAFIIIAYGKLGGIELSYGSDLDVVFIHDLPGQQLTDGTRAIENEQFVARLGQRMIHILTAQTTLGALYEMDMRLRPSGSSGMLVSSFKAFQRYQQQDAWVWEHQALVRARAVAGFEPLAQAFAALRCSLLTMPRSLPYLRAEIVAMRNKMRAHWLSQAGNEQTVRFFVLKQGLGGIVDIEFMVQYAVLAWSSQYPALTNYTDNIRILEVLVQYGLLTTVEQQLLTDIYKRYRSYSHRLSLQQLPLQVDYDLVADDVSTVIKIWQQLLE